MNQKIELPPILGDPIKHRFHLAGSAHVERKKDRRLGFTGQRLDELSGFVVEIGHRELGPERAKRLGTAPGNRLVVGDADDKPLFSFQQLGLDHRNHFAHLSC